MAVKEGVKLKDVGAAVEAEVVVVVVKFNPKLLLDPVVVDGVNDGWLDIKLKLNPEEVEVVVVVVVVAAKFENAGTDPDEIVVGAEDVVVKLKAVLDSVEGAELAKLNKLS